MTENNTFTTGSEYGGSSSERATEEQKMEFTANMNILPENKSSLYAAGTVTIDQLFVLKDIKVIYLQKEGMDEKQLTICMPRHYNRKTESWDYVIQLTKEQRKEMEKAILSDLSQKIGSSIYSPDEYCKIQINLCDPSLAPTLGYAEISYRDMLNLKKIRIAEGNDGRIQVFLPANRNKDGGYSSLFGMVTADHQKGFEESIREKFREVYREVTGREFTGTSKEDSPNSMMDDDTQETEDISKGQVTQSEGFTSTTKVRHGR